MVQKKKRNAKNSIDLSTPVCYIKNGPPIQSDLCFTLIFWENATNLNLLIISTNIFTCLWKWLINLKIFYLDKKELQSLFVCDYFDFLIALFVINRTKFYMTNISKYTKTIFLTVRMFKFMLFHIEIKVYRHILDKNWFWEYHLFYININKLRI